MSLADDTLIMYSRLQYAKKYYWTWIFLFSPKKWSININLNRPPPLPLDAVLSRGTGKRYKKEVENCPKGVGTSGGLFEAREAFFKPFIFSSPSHFNPRFSTG
jgi:hypothetical protein